MTEKTPHAAETPSPKAILEGELGALLKRHESESLRLLKLEDMVKNQSVQVGYIEGQIDMAKRTLARMEVKA